jgi:hypothetical protein
MAAFIISGLFTSLFRHNGWPVVLLSCLVLLWFERRHFRWVLPGVAAVFILRMLITGPLYMALQVPPTPAMLTYNRLLYNIAAHLNSGGELKPEEEAALLRLAPIEDWVFDPCSVMPLYQNLEGNEASLETSRADYLRIAWDQLRANPLPNLKALDSLGAFVYRLNPGCSLYLSPLTYQPSSASGASWTDFDVDNKTGEAPLLPAFVRPIARFYDQSNSYDDIRVLYVLFWQPVVYLVLFILAMAGFFYLQRRRDGLIIIAPAVFQTLVIFFMSPAQQTRFQYGLILISIYSVALFLWAYYDAKRAEKPLEDK